MNGRDFLIECKGTAAILAAQLGIFLAMTKFPPELSSHFYVRGIDVLRGDYSGAFLSIFAHQAPFHWFSNAYGTFILGSIFERWVGTGPFLLVYLASGILGNVVSLLFLDPLIPSLGSSGAVFGLIGALVAYEMKRGRSLREFWNVEFGRQLITVLLLNLGIGLFFSRMINNYAHVGGLIGGYVITYLFVAEDRTAYTRFDRLLRVGVVLLAVELTVWSAVPAFRPIAASALAYSAASVGGDLDRATRIAEDAFRIRPGHASTESALAVCYLRQGRPGDAVPLLVEAISKREDRASVATDLLWLSIALDRVGSRDDAVRCFRDAEQAFPDASRAPGISAVWFEAKTELGL